MIGLAGLTIAAAAALPGWELVAPPATALDEVLTQRANGVIEAKGKPVGYFASRERYHNFRMHVEWRWPGKPGNAGVLLHIDSGPKDGPWPLSLQVQMKSGSAGDMLPMAGATFTEPLTSAPGTTRIRAHTAPDSEKPAGEWNAADILCRDGVIEVNVNGVAQNRVTRVAPSSGRVGFQLEGTPFELRNVSVTPLD